MNFAKLDSLLAALPPPPSVSASAPATRTRFLFVGPPRADPVAVYPLRDENHERISKHAKSIPTTAWKASVLIGLNMKLSKLGVVRSPKYIARNGDEFPETTDIRCWWCRNQFKTRPIGIPFKRVKGVNEFLCFGNFCSFECALAGSTESGSMRMRMFAGSYLCLMRRDIAGIPLAEPLRPAPHWSALKEYGGHLTLDEFRAGQTQVRAIPENIRLFPVGYNLFEECRRVNRRGKRKTTSSLFEDAKKRSSIMKKKKGGPTFYKTNFSHIKLKLTKKKGKNSKLKFSAPKKGKLNLF